LVVRKNQSGALFIQTPQGNFKRTKSGTVCKKIRHRKMQEALYSTQMVMGILTSMFVSGGSEFTNVSTALIDMVVFQ
jgi:hypothetical protein